MNTNQASASPTIQDERDILAEQLLATRERLTELLTSNELSRHALVDCLHDARMTIRAISLAQPEAEVFIESAGSEIDQISEVRRADAVMPRVQRHRMTVEINRLLADHNETPDQLQGSIRGLIRLTKDAEEQLLPHHTGEGGVFREYAIEELPPGKVLELRDQFQRLGAQTPTPRGLARAGRTDSMGIGTGKAASGVRIAYETQSYPGRRDDEQPESVVAVLAGLGAGDPRAALVMNADHPDGKPVLVVPAATPHGVLPGHVVMVSENTWPQVVDISLRSGRMAEPREIHERLADNLKHLRPAENPMATLDDLDHLQECIRELPVDDATACRYGVQAMQLRLQQLVKRVSVPTPESTRAERQAQIRALELAHVLGMEQGALPFALPRQRGDFAPGSSPAAYLGVKKDVATGEFRYALVNRIGDVLGSGDGYETHKQAYQAGFRNARELNATGQRIPTLAIRQPEYSPAASGYQVVGLTGPSGEPMPITPLGHWMTSRSRAALTSLTPEQITETPHWKAVAGKTIGAGRSQEDAAAIKHYLAATLNPSDTPNSSESGGHPESLSQKGLKLAGTESAVRVSDYLIRYGSDSDLRLAVQMQIQTSELPSNEKRAVIDHLNKLGSCDDWIREGQRLVELSSSSVSLPTP